MYGQVKARLVQWDINGTRFEHLDTHPCTNAELGLTDDSEAS